MVSKHVLTKSVSAVHRRILRPPVSQRRGLHYDGRNRLSNFWTPTQRQPTGLTEPENGHDLLIRAGFLRQAHTGIFHLLPLGLRVQNKIESLIDKHMQSLGASKVSLSSLSTEDLWQRSGRLDKGRTSELLRLEDRRGTKFLLSPTHEEEITTIIANAVHSYKELPLRLYQVSRKYRDEPRPRQGLLRGREFLMKDLYTFDTTEQQARQTYEDVRKAYVAFLDELKLPYLVAQADSGNMGGNLSHEYHFASPQGEDNVITCDTCDYSINEELYIGYLDPDKANANVADSSALSNEIAKTQYVSKDRKAFCTVVYMAEHGEPNIYAIKQIWPDVDAGLRDDDAMEAMQFEPESHVIFRDPRVPIDALTNSEHVPRQVIEDTYCLPSVAGKAVLLTKARQGDNCPSCHTGKLKLQQAVEIGHTFHLGTRYSKPLEAHVLDANNKQLPIEMGCHGIGVSRLIGAVASLLADKQGLNWPLALAPFEVVVVPAGKTEPCDLHAVYDQLTADERLQHPGLDVTIDDRDRPLGWKLNDADLIGYPFILILGKAWKDRKVVELQCRRLGLKTEVGVEDIVRRLRELSRDYEKV